jgi:hypothetical protein
LKIFSQGYLNHFIDGISNTSPLRSPYEDIRNGFLYGNNPAVKRFGSRNSGDFGYVDDEGNNSAVMESPNINRGFVALDEE